MAQKNHIKKILTAAILIIIGQIIFKYLPMKVFGKDILFDSSNHIAGTILALYAIWFFIDQNKSWRIPYFIFSSAVVVIMAIQRIISKNHNEVGVTLGLIICMFGVATAEHLFL